ETHFQVLSWHDALQTLLQYWKRAQPARSFFYVSGRSSMEAAFLVQLLARQWGTNNVNNCSYYCHQASGVGLTQSLGSGTSTVTLGDLQKTDLVVLVGANPASNHPRLMTVLARLRRRGGKVVVINPLQEIGLQRFSVPSDIRSLLFGSEIANLYLQPHCGGDLALLKAAAARLWQQGKADVEFLQRYCNHFAEFKRDLEEADVAGLLEKAGIASAELDAFCECLAASQRTVFAWAMGITHQQHGVQNVRALANLALLRGMVGKPGAGLLPIRGHSNVQGVGTVGVVPKLKPKMAEALLEHLNVKVPDTPGLDTFSCMEAAARGEIDFAVLVGGNLYAANPDLKWAAAALGQIEFTAFLSTTLN
ncbi:MAG: histidine kinase, partial [Calditrichaeota bacterium]